MILEHMSDDIPLQMQKAARHPTICDIINGVKLFLDILLQIFDVI